MANPYLFNAIGGFGDAFMKSYNAQTDKNRRDAQEDEDRAAAAEDRAWTQGLRQREIKKLDLEDKIQAEATAGAAPGELEEFEEPAAGPAPEGGQPAPTAKKWRIKGTDQTFSDAESAAAGLGKFNAPAQRQMRAADRVSALDFQRGLKMRQDAVVAQQNESALDEATQQQVVSTANRVLVESVPFSPNWGASAVGHINTLAGREVAKAVPLQDGSGFSIQVTGADGKVVNSGTYTNDEAGWTKYIHASLKRTPSQLLTYIDATRRAQMELDAKRVAQEEAENRWRDRQVFADGIRDDNRTQSGSSSRSGGGSSAPAGTTSDPKVAAQAAADAVVEASKNADGAMKLSPEQLNDARANAERVILANPGMSPNVAAAVATKITQSPDSVKPHLNKKTGRIDGMYEDPQSGDLYKVYAYPASRLTDDDRVAMRQGVREMRAELAAGDAKLASLVDGLAFGGQDAEKPLADYLVRKNIAAAREQFKAAGKPVPSDEDLTRIATAHVERVAMPMVRGQAGAIRQYGEKPRQEKAAGRVSPAIFGSDASSGYVPPEGSPAARAAANRRAALSAQQQSQAGIDAKRQAAADEAIKVANSVIASRDPAQAQAFQDSPQFENLPREMKLRVRNIVFGSN